MYDSYDNCRSQTLITFTKATRDKKEKLVVVQWPTGFSTLPYKGGWFDQPYIVTRLFAAAMRGEKQGASRLMSK